MLLRMHGIIYDKFIFLDFFQMGVSIRSINIFTHSVI